ncbi:hypothetical protein JZ751_007802, partial [Albula glossodonta]
CTVSSAHRAMAGVKKNPAAIPPDGGWGWMIVAGCFVVTVCTRAVTRCISIFFVEFQIHFAHDYSRTAWIHSLVDCTTMLCVQRVGAACGVSEAHVQPCRGKSWRWAPGEISQLITPLLDGQEYGEATQTPLGSFIGNRLSCRIAVILGGFLASMGLVLSSFATSLEYLYLTLGVLTGVGFALCYTPAIAMVGAYFSPNRLLFLARGPADPGGPRLKPVCLWGSAEAISNKDEEESSPIKVGSEKPPDTSVPPGSLVSSKDREHSCFCFQSLQEYSFLLMPDFMVLAASFLFLANGCSVPFVYLVPYALSMGVSHQQAAFLMSILGVIDIVGNITFGWLTDRSFPLLVPFSVLYGYFDGAYVALIPVVTSDVVGNTYLSSALGVVYFLHAIPYLISPPIGGWLVDQTGSYMATFFLSGFSLISSSLLLSAVTVIRRCQKARAYAAKPDPNLDTCQSTNTDYYKDLHEDPKLAANVLSL